MRICVDFSKLLQYSCVLPCKSGGHRSPVSPPHYNPAPSVVTAQKMELDRPVVKHSDTGAPYNDMTRSCKQLRRSLLFPGCGQSRAIEEGTGIVEDCLGRPPASARLNCSSSWLLPSGATADPAASRCSWPRWVSKQCPRLVAVASTSGSLADPLILCVIARSSATAPHSFPCRLALSDVRSTHSTGRLTGVLCSWLAGQ